MSPLQILFARQSLTALCCCIWLTWNKIPLLGIKEVRWLLVARGLSGFCGIFSMYYSLQYLPIADAVVITFLAPPFAAYACNLFLHEPFPRSAQVAALISLLGVVLIARPTSFFNSASSPVNFTVPENGTSEAMGTTSSPAPTSTQRFSAILVSLLGVVGSAGAFTFIRLIGERAHPLISVNYFSTWCTIVSVTYLSVSKTFHLPSNFHQWSLLLFLSICGLITQYLLTKGLAGKTGGVRATQMIYTNMLFALALDRWIFGIIPGWWSLAGSGLILACAIFIAMNTTGNEKIERCSDEEVAVSDEETREILPASDEGEEEDG